MKNNLLHLLHLSDPALPVGGYAHSYGLEMYVQKGIIKNAATAKEFVSQMLTQNLRYTDAAFLSLAYDAAKQNDLPTLLQLDTECTAIKLPKEIRQASEKTGRRLMKIFEAHCCATISKEYNEEIKRGEAAGHYCLLFGLFSFLLHIEKAAALQGFYYNAAAGMITNCVKLIPLSQQAGQDLLISLLPLIQQLAQASLHPDKDLLGLSCAGFDLRCMQHERLYSRLYMS